MPLLMVGRPTPLSDVLIGVGYQSTRFASVTPLRDLVGFLAVALRSRRYATWAVTIAHTVFDTIRGV
jgi:hypothetical protein